VGSGVRDLRVHVLLCPLIAEGVCFDQNYLDIMIECEIRVGITKVRRD
jgi:hypothetical protein